ncbi:MAG: ATP-binding cassette domain-containing protein [Rhizobiaceae bacterium]|jgi:putative thiamine transport system ATP-binding protein|nr:ATP-binding cassette domain-containing protein [Rhizobiaceae bacterium]
MHGLTLEQVTIRLGRRMLLAITADVAAGEVLTVMGPSGSGKSTLFNWIAGFLDPAFNATGTVRLDGEDIGAKPAHQRRIGLLFQDALLFPHMSVAGNLMFALPQSVRGRVERQARVEAALADAGLAGFGARDPDTLSGGQKARVALMRTLLAEPRALLLDEPFSKLDADLRAQMREVVFSTARRHALPVVLVTHDEADALAAGGPVIRLGGSEGSM